MAGAAVCKAACAIKAPRKTLPNVAPIPMRVHMYVPLHYDRTASRCGSFEPAADGYWTRPPFAHAYWVAPYWERGRYSEGYWYTPRGQYDHDYRWDRDRGRGRQ